MVTVGSFVRVAVPRSAPPPGCSSWIYNGARRPPCDEPPCSSPQHADPDVQIAAFSKETTESRALPSAPSEPQYCVGRIVSVSRSPSDGQPEVSIVFPAGADPGDQGAAVVKAPMQSAQPTFLVILDLNGVLVSRRSGKNTRARPMLSDFLQLLFENFAVGVWTSCEEHNGRSAISTAFQGRKSQLVFSFFRPQCDRHPSIKFGTIKNLNRVWDFAKNGFAAGPESTIIVDDSIDKCSHRACTLWPIPYAKVDPEDRELEYISDVLLAALHRGVGRHWDVLAAAQRRYCQCMGLDSQEVLLRTATLRPCPASSCSSVNEAGAHYNMRALNPCMAPNAGADGRDSGIASSSAGAPASPPNEPLRPPFCFSYLTCLPSSASSGSADPFAAALKSCIIRESEACWAIAVPHKAALLHIAVVSKAFTSLKEGINGGALSAQFTCALKEMTAIAIEEADRLSRLSALLTLVERQASSEAFMSMLRHSIGGHDDTHRWCARSEGVHAQRLFAAITGLSEPRVPVRMGIHLLKFFPFDDRLAIHVVSGDLLYTTAVAHWASFFDRRLFVDPREVLSVFKDPRGMAPWLAEHNEATLGELRSLLGKHDPESRSFVCPLSGRAGFKRHQDRVGHTRQCLMELSTSIAQGGASAFF